MHEHPRIGSDGESEEVSGASDEKDEAPVQVKLRNKPPGARRTSEVSGCKRINLVLLNRILVTVNRV